MGYHSRFDATVRPSREGQKIPDARDCECDSLSEQDGVSVEDVTEGFSALGYGVRSF